MSEGQQQRQLVTPEFVRIPIQDVQVIPDGVSGLQQFLVSGIWRNPAWNRAVLLHRPDAGGYYVFSNAGFRLRCLYAEKFGFSKIIADHLKVIFRIRESMGVACLRDSDSPQAPSVVLDGGKPQGIWVRDQRHEQQLAYKGMNEVRSVDIDFSRRQEEREFDRAKNLESLETTNRELTSFNIDEVDQDNIRRTPHMDLNLESPVNVGTVFDVLIYADQSAARPDEETEDISIPTVPGQNEYVIRVWLATTDDFELLEPSPLKPLLIKRDEARSQPVAFKLKVIKEIDSKCGATITALFSYNGRASGRVTRIVSCDHIQADRKPPSSALGVDGKATAADLIVDICDPGNSLRNFECVLTTSLVDAYKTGVHCKWNLNDTTSQIVSSFFQLFTTCKDPSQCLAALKGAGRNLFKATPDEFKNLFWQIIDSGKPMRSISIVSQEPYIPWELMIPWRRRDDGSTEVRQPLGAEFAVARWLRDDHLLPNQRVSLADSRIFAPAYPGPRPKPLASAQAEAQMVTAIFPGQAISPALFKNFKEAMKAGGASLLHFICHGAAGQGIAQQIYLEDNRVMSSIQIDGLDEVAEACGKKKPLIFLNACEVGREAPSLVGVGGFASSFIGAGASCVIAPLWSVKDDIAHKVATEFYETVKANPGKPFAEILRAIRARAYDATSGGEDTYAAYCFYGDPLAVRA
jgi:CHAT domain